MTNKIPEDIDTTPEVDNKTPNLGNTSSKRPKEKAFDDGLTEGQPIADNTHPIPDSLTKRPKKSLPLAIIIAIISLIVLILIVLYMQFINKPSTDTTEVQVQSETIEATTPQVAPLEIEDRNKSSELETAASESVAEDTVEATTESTTDLDVNLENIPDPEEILSAPIPESEVLVKEEIQRLSDEEQRLEEQKVLLAEQVAMMDELNAKKEQQVALLEQQIAQLEQENSAE